MADPGSIEMFVLIVWYVFVIGGRHAFVIVLSFWRMPKITKITVELAAKP